MNWSPDYCLACDRQTAGGAYCSQACRLADLSKAHDGAEPLSPISSSARTASWSASPPARSGFYLPPALDFAALRARARQGAALRSQPKSPPAGTRSTSSWTSPSAPRTQRGGGHSSSLTPSASQSSLASIQTTSSSSSSSSAESDALSDQARLQLGVYARSFDQVRDLKRRILMG